MKNIIKVIFAITIVVAVTILSITKEGLNYQEQWWIFLFLGFLGILYAITSSFSSQEKIKKMSLTELSEYHNKAQEQNDTKKVNLIKREIRRR